ncbi:hypothetical protein [Nocardia fusca]|uniref:Uncharacterized protein n=1 Tax=Nocardia fusca TaxID=941183 RepID=A0ABV3FJ80_9NOCA
MNLFHLAGVAAVYAWIGLVVLVGPVSVVLAARDVRQHPYLPALRDVEQLELDQLERAA